MDAQTLALLVTTTLNAVIMKAGVNTSPKTIADRTMKIVAAVVEKLK